MACYHPLKAFKIGYNDKTGKDKYKITSYDVDHLEMYSPSQGFEKKYTPVISCFAKRVVTNPIDIPCGQCIGCRLSKSVEWANRCSLECDEYESNYFITLTYDDDHLPLVENIDSESGEIIQLETLYKKDLQDFQKRLRTVYQRKCEKLIDKGLLPKDFDYKLRFFSIGEYGGSSARPHYHLIVFNLKLDDLVPYKQNFEDDWYYTSEWLNGIWELHNKNDKFGRSKGNLGYVVVSEVDWECIAYVARYTTKKLYGKESKFYKKWNITPEFAIMSRNPGIGFNWYKENKERFKDENKFFIPSKNGARPISIPRYFANLYLAEYPNDAKQRKQNNLKFIEDMKTLKSRLTDKDYYDILKTEEDILNKKISVLKRDL